MNAAIGFFLLVVIAGSFLLPAIIVIWPFEASFVDAFSRAFGSLWAWLGSAAFWAVIGYLVYAKWWKHRQTRGPGRQFNCWQCHQAVTEMTLGDLERTGVICPFCQANNVLQQSQ